jgi:integrase
MNIKYLKLRHATYWYQRRIPKALEGHFKRTGVYSQNLNTGDLTAAVSGAREINKLWDSLAASPSESPAEVFRSEVLRLEADSTPDFPEDLSVDTDAEWSQLSPADRARYRAAQTVVLGRPTPIEYGYSLREGLKEIVSRKQEVVKPKSLDKYGKAVDVFLGAREDMPMALITPPDVAAWLDTLMPTSKHQTRKQHLGHLARIWDNAVRLGRIEDKRNPFRNQEHGRDDTVHYEFMSDDQLTSILAHLKEPDHRPAIIARFTGMRLSEVFQSKLDTVEDRLCFVVEDAKTEAGNRIVPVRKSLCEAVRGWKEGLHSPAAYSKRFGKAKAKATGAGRELTFHSLRASFITYAGQAGYTEQQVAWLVGHETSKGAHMTGQVYFKGYSLDLMSEIVEAVPSIRPFSGP